MTPGQLAALAYRTLRSELGRRAADESWCNELWDFVYAQGRDPDDAEQRALREQADAKWKELPEWPFPAARQAIIGRYERLKREAYKYD